MSFNPKVVLVGRTNVGKSTLFNKLIGRRESIIHDEEGVTRDPIRALYQWRGYDFELIDSGGLDFDSNDIISSKITHSAQQEINDASILVLVTNIRDGVLSIEKKIALELKKTLKPVILCVNKCDDWSDGKNLKLYEFYCLGFGDPIAISSIHGHGTGDLLDKVFDVCDSLGYLAENKNEIENNEQPIKIAIIGKPNAGKSSLINRLCGKDKFMVSEIAGTTRDAVSVMVFRKDLESDVKKKYIFVDTAGIKRSSKNISKIEWYSLDRTENAIKNSDICISVIDAADGITKQDIKIAGLAKNHGKACVLLINKWDLIENRDREVIKFQEKIKHDFVFMSYSKPLFVSVKTGLRVEKIFDIIDFYYKNYSLRLSTGILNDILRQIIKRVTPPKINEQQLKIYYVTQVSTRPPVFVFFVNKKRLFHFSYERHIENCLRQTFDFSGTPIKFLIREKKVQQDLEDDKKNLVDNS